MNIFEQAEKLMASKQPKARRSKGRRKSSYKIRREGKVVKEVSVAPKSPKVKRKGRSADYLAPFDRSMRNAPDGVDYYDNDQLRQWLGKYAWEKRAELLKVLGGRYHSEDLLPCSVNELLLLLAEVRKDGAKNLFVQEVSEIGTEERLGKFRGSFEKVSHERTACSSTDGYEDFQMIGAYGATVIVQRPVRRK